MISRIDPQDIVAALDDAVEALLWWCAEWHTSFVVGDKSDNRCSQLDSVRYFDPFLQWFDTHRDVGIVNQPSMIRLHDLLVSIRHRVELIANQKVQIEDADYHGLMADFSSFVMQARRLERAFATASSDLDSLTGIQNRHALHRALSSEYERVQRSGRASVLALVDLDHFKSINDKHGHAVGDRVLRVASGVLAQHVRTNDQVFRYGGEEFLILLSDTDQDTAAVVLERLRIQLARREIASNGINIRITASIGATVMRSDIEPERTIELADEALYSAKQNGRNRIEFNTSKEN